MARARLNLLAEYERTQDYEWVEYLAYRNYKRRQRENAFWDVYRTVTNPRLWAITLGLAWTLFMGWVLYPELGTHDERECTYCEGKINVDRIAQP